MAVQVRSRPTCAAPCAANWSAHSERRESGDVHFERVIIETTGLADPARVAQTLFIEPDIAENFKLDAIVTVIDAVHAHLQL